MITETLHGMKNVNIHTPYCESNFLILDFKYS